jgi:hypothetical protein
MLRELKNFFLYLKKKSLCEQIQYFILMLDQSDILSLKL